MISQLFLSLFFFLSIRRVNQGDSIRGTVPFKIIGSIKGTVPFKIIEPSPER